MVENQFFMFKNVFKQKEDVSPKRLTSHIPHLSQAPAPVETHTSPSEVYRIR